jgi:hypothetical protein
VALVEDRHHAVALLPLGDLGADRDDLAGAVGRGDYGEREREGVFALFLVC